MNDASLEILRACSTMTRSMVGMAVLTPIYVAIWSLTWMTSGPRQSPIPSRA